MASIWQSVEEELATRCGRLRRFDDTVFDLGPGTNRPAAWCRRAEERLARLRRLVAEL